jgi:probable phosphoglycerate mutase
LLRHAQSEWNAAGRWQGWADPGLSPEGVAHAASVALDPALDGISAVATSDLRRANQTASIIASARGLEPPRTYRGLRERGAGAFTGLTRAEIEERWPGVFEAHTLDIPGGERIESLTARAVATLHRIAAEWPGRAVLAVCHGALIRSVERHAGTEPGAVPNLGGRWVTVHQGRLSIGAGVALALAVLDA